MGTIKDISDLTTQLIKSVKDRDIVAKIATIQSLISSVQSENSTLHSKNLELNKTILNLKQKVFDLEKEIYNLKQKQEPSSLQHKYVFDDRYGIYKSKETGHYFCTSCLLSPEKRESPLTKKKTGWQCEYEDCERFYDDPNWQSPQNSGGGPNSWMGS